MGLDAAMSVGITIGDLKDAADGVAEKVLGAKKPRPSYITRSMAFTSTGDVIQLALGSPPVGFIWEVRGVTIFGADDHTVIANTTCALYFGDQNNLSLTQLKIPGMSIPSVTFLPTEAFWCHSTEELVIQSSIAIASGTQLGCNIVINEWRESEISRRFA